MKVKRLLAKLTAENSADCSRNSCPAIMEAENGDFIVIGKKPTQQIDLSDFACVADDEYVVVVPKELLLKAKDLI